MFTRIRHASVPGLLALLAMSAAVSPAGAAPVDFTSWTTAGDVSTGVGTASMSTNFAGDEAPDDALYKFSLLDAVPAGDLELDLGLTDPAPFPLGLEAFEGSGLTGDLTFASSTFLKFDWTFLTNEEFGGIGLDDYAFIAIDGSVEPITSAQSAAGAASSPYVREFSGSFSRLFAPGTYDIALGVVDVDDLITSSAFVVTNAQTIIPTPVAAALVAPLLLCLGLRRPRRE